MTAQTVADGFGADEIVFDVTAPQVIGAVDAKYLRVGGADDGLRWQQIQLAALMFGRIETAAEFAAENLRQPTRQCLVGLDFMLRRLGTHRMGHDDFVAGCRGHAFPFISRWVLKGNCRDQANQRSPRTAR